MTAPAATLASPTRMFLVMLRILWRQRRCHHIGWAPLDGWCCPECRKELPR